jgi:hypothetical protein
MRSWCRSFSWVSRSSPGAVLHHLLQPPGDLLLLAAVLGDVPADVDELGDLALLFIQSG